MNRVIYLGLFLLILPLDLGISLFTLYQFTKTGSLPGLFRAQTEELFQKKFLPQVYASLPEATSEIHTSIKTGDARPIIIGKYLEKYHSPMKPYSKIAQKIVEVSEELNLDWRLLVAIAQQESNLGKKMPPDCNNAWGYGIHSQGTLCFESWEEGIETVAGGLKKRYVDQGLDTPEEIMAKYTPHSSGSWANGVNQFLDELQNGEVE
ncbi:MAG: glucosaminidase domain-containing protein [Candidatus Pacebacteria bacterium]|nr:glucosaminidase domain-containing protein [Candidatus Paceibacterota bacterium]